MGRPRKVDYSDPDGYFEKGGKQPPNPPPPPVATSAGAFQTMEDPYKMAARLKAERAKTNDGYKLGAEWVSGTGHKVIVTGVGTDEVTFGFTRIVKGDPEQRERSVPLKQIQFFLKSYKPA